jgi:predicted Zn-dependent protease
VLALICALGAPASAADRTALKPGWNIFSPEQDVEMGKEVAVEAERELPIMNNRQITAYIDSLGKRLAAHAPGERYPYQFKVVNDRAINAFALPGGYIYVNRGTIEAAQNEGQLSGVLAHEIAHVALRHGTNQVSKAYIAQVPLALLGGALGGNSIGGVLAQLGIGFATNSILLKYSRDAERQADILGTQMLYDAGYNPNDMVDFFERLQAESRGRATEFFSSHPNPENRISNVQGEIQKLGGMRSGLRSNSTQFQQVKNLIGSAPVASGPTGGGDRPTATGRPELPSTRLVRYNGRDVEFAYPENWRVYGQGSALTIAPDAGIVDNQLAWGMIASTFEPELDWNDRGVSLQQATDQLIENLRQANPNLRMRRSRERIRIDGQPALSMEMTNTSPTGGREVDWLVTVLHPDGTLYYFVGVAPQNEYQRYVRAFEDVLENVRFRN